MEVAATRGHVQTPEVIRHRRLPSSNPQLRVAGAHEVDAGSLFQWECCFANLKMESSVA